MLAVQVLASGAAPAVADSPPPAVVEHLAEAIRIRTISHQDPSKLDPEAFAAFRSFLRSTYACVFSKVEFELVSEHSLLGRWPGSDASLEPVLLEGHYDVVPIEPGTFEDWTHPPWSGAIADGFVWGRGAMDDKAAVVSLFEAADALCREGFAPARTLWLAIGHDEEVAGSRGASEMARILDERGVRLAFMIGEGGGLARHHPLLPDDRVAMIGLAEKTYVTLHFSVLGTGGHSSAPPRDSAIVRMAKAMTALHEQPMETKIVSPVDDMLEALAPHIGGLTGLVLAYPSLTGPLVASQLSGDRIGQTLVRTTTGVTLFSAGVKENVVPQRAEASVNFRLLPGDDLDDLLAAVRERIDDDGIEIDGDLWGPIAPVADREGEGYRRIEATLASVFPEAVIVPTLVTATTDSRHYAILTDDVLRARPYTIDLSYPLGIHDTNERLAVESLVEAEAFYRELLPAISKP